MRRSILVATALGVVGLLCSACDVSALPYAAKVGGTSVSVSKLDAVLDAFRSDASLGCLMAAQSTVVNGTGAGSFSATFTSQRLSELIDLQLGESDLAALGLSVTPYATAAAISELETAFEPANAGSCTTSGADFLAALPPSYKAVLVGLQQNELMLDAHLAGAQLSASGIATFEQGHRQEMTLSCVSAIVVPTEARATQLSAEIRAGASFASLAKADSTDSGSAANGGAIGCVPPLELQAPLGSDIAGLATGALSSPISFNSSWVLLEITSRSSLATASAAVQAIFDSESVHGAALAQRLDARVPVEVNPQYGSWSGRGAAAQVTSPVGPADSLLQSPSAVTPS